MSLRAVLYVRSDGDKGDLQQQHDAFDIQLDIVARACADADLDPVVIIRHLGPESLNDAVDAVVDEDADVLVIAHPDVLGGRGEWVHARLAAVGAHLHTARGTVRRRRSRRDAVRMATRMQARGYPISEIAAILEMEARHVRALLGRGTGAVGAAVAAAAATAVLVMVWPAAPSAEQPDQVEPPPRNDQTTGPADQFRDAPDPPAPPGPAREPDGRTGSRSPTQPPSTGPSESPPSGETRLSPERRCPRLRPPVRALSCLDPHRLRGLQP